MRFVFGITLLAAMLALAPASADEPYSVKPGQTCGGYPKLQIGLAPGLCAGIVVDKTFGIRMPRTLIQTGPSEWLVADMGGWGTKSGAIWKLESAPGGKPTARKLLSRLNMPHMIATGPDGRTYVGEMGRIFAFDPKAANPASTIAEVISDLPSNELHADRHPLSAFLFAPDGALLVNIGAPSDQCLGPNGKPSAPRCAEADGPPATGVVRRYAPAGPGRWNPDFSVFASGLRNSMAMLATQSGQILQVENSIDISNLHEPFDEINLLKAGHNYGWPYCMDRDTPTPGWAAAIGKACARDHDAPIILLPPHSAPLGMTWYAGAMLPALKGRLLVSLHGPREGGASILAFRTDAAGLPTGAPENLTPGWAALKGARPRGRPVGLTVAADGAIWVADDRNHAIIRIAAEAPSAKPGG